MQSLAEIVAAAAALRQFVAAIADGSVAFGHVVVVGLLLSARPFRQPSALLAAVVVDHGFAGWHAAVDVANGHDAVDVQQQYCLKLLARLVVADALEPVVVAL